MHIRSFVLALLGLVLLFAPNAARADDDDYDTPVEPGSKVTYRDLIRLVFPDAREGSYGQTAIPVRSFSSDDEPAPDDVTKIGACVVRRVPDGAASRLVLYLGIEGPEVNVSSPADGEGSLVAVFDPGPTLKLLDLVDVQEDRFTDFDWDGPAGGMGPGARAFTVSSSHFNSSQEYEILTVIYVHDGRLKRAASISTLSSRICERETSEKATLRFRPRAGGALADLVATVEVTTRRGGSDCEIERSRPSIRRYTETYRWSASKREYVDAGGTLRALAKFNRVNY